MSDLLPWEEEVKEALTMGDLFGDIDETEEDFLSGVTCNPDAPEECESCQ